MNDYIFVVNTSDERGGDVATQKFVVCAENIEKAEEKVREQLKNICRRFRCVEDVKKL